MRRGTPYIICDTDGRPVTAAAAKAIIAEHWTLDCAARDPRPVARQEDGEGP